MTTVAALLVTHQSSQWIDTTLLSVLAQSRPVDRIVVVDDRSTDGTVDLVQAVIEGRGMVVQSVSTATDRTTRIAQNFRQGLIACAGADVVVLGDHDDLWHPDRVAHQVALLDSTPAAVMVASDGVLVDEEGRATAGTLRTAFPIPVEWPTATPAERMRAALRRSIATGGASAVRPNPLAGQGIPAGWLHDRWWSLVATAMEAMVVDDAPVIDYRVSDSQAVGLAGGYQRRSAAGRVRAGLLALPRTSSRISDLQKLRAFATEAVRPELGGSRLLRNLA